MSKTKLTKNELKKQKDALKRYQCFLPMLQLKKQQLQIEVRKIAHELDRIKMAHQKSYEELMLWVDVFSGDPPIAGMVKILGIITESANIAGVQIPLFRDLSFQTIKYDLFETPLWIDNAIIAIQNLYQLEAKLLISKRQLDLINRELKKTSQRVNLFEKVKIPEVNKHIRKLRIYLGDQQTASVVRGKISKRKLKGRAGSGDEKREVKGRKTEGTGFLSSMTSIDCESIGI